MSSFQKTIHNKRLKNYFFETITNTLIDASKIMVADISESNESLKNDENKIRNHLLEYYLNNNKVKEANNLKALFQPESQENYVGKYLGRIDIKVIGYNTFDEPKDYYIIECKRIDGYSTLNKEYINEGVKRFVTEQYTSYNNKNIMFGFVVKDINIKDNTQKINDLQSSSELNKDSIKSGFIETSSRDNTFALYSSEYVTSTNKPLELRHLFYNFHSIIK